MSLSLSDFAMTRELKQLAGTTYNDSLLELGELLQDNAIPSDGPDVSFIHL